MKNNIKEPYVPKFSDEINSFIKLLAAAEKDYQWNIEKMRLYDKETQDIMHSIELDKLTKNERNRLATRLMFVRKQRRVHKNIIEATQPLVEYLSSEKGKQTFNLLREVLGKTRKVEEYHANRTYHKKAPEIAPKFDKTS